MRSLFHVAAVLLFVILGLGEAHGAGSVGRVEDAFTQEPVAGAEVVVLSGAREIARAVSAADGSFEVRVAPGTTTRIRVRANGFAEGIIDFTKDNVTISVYRGVPVRGFVMSAGKPVARASVTCRPGILRETAPVFTDKTGAFQIACPSGHVHLVGRAPGLGAAIAHLAGNVEGEARETTILLGAPVVLEGRVLDDGKPVAGVDVMAYPDADYLNDRPTVGAITDAQGRFRMEPVAAGLWKLAAYHDYRVGVVTTISAFAGTKVAPVDVTLEPAYPLLVRVTVAGAPAREVPISLGCNDPEKRANLLAGFHYRYREERGDPQGRFSHWDATSDASGIARFPTRMKGTCWVAVDDDVGRGGKDVRITDAETTLDLLPASSLGGIRGRVVIVGEPEQPELSVSAIASGKSATGYAFSRVKEDRTFEIANLAPGRYALSMNDGALMVPPVSVEVVAGKTVEAVVIASRRSDANGRVVDAKTGMPILRVDFVAECKSKQDGMMFPPKVTDAEGRVHLEGVSGNLTVVFMKAGYQSKTISLDVPAGGEIALGTIAMSPGASPTAVLRTDATTISGAGISADDVKYLVRPKELGINACYQRALVAKPDLRGTLSVEFEVLPNGLWNSITMNGPVAITDRWGLENCIRTQFYGVHFSHEPVRGGVVRVALPIDFGVPAAPAPK